MFGHAYRRRAQGWSVDSSSAMSSAVSARSAAARFCSRWATRDVPAALVVAKRADFGDQHETLGIGVQGLTNQLVGDIGPIELSRVDVVDAELDRAPQHRDRLRAITRRAHDTAARELHRAETDPMHAQRAQRERMHDPTLALRHWWPAQTTLQDVALLGA